MAKDTISTVGNFIKNNKQPLIYVGGAIAVIVIGYAVVSKVTKGIGGSFADKSTGATPFTPIPVDDTKSTISNATAITYANQLFGSMNTVGTDESAIYSIFQKIQKKDDFLKVYNAFGRKSYGGLVLGGEPNKVDKWLGNYDDYDLIQWLNKEVGWSNLPTYSLIKKTVENAGLTI